MYHSSQRGKMQEQKSSLYVCKLLFQQQFFYLLSKLKALEDQQMQTSICKDSFF